MQHEIVALDDDNFPKKSPKEPGNMSHNFMNQTFKVCQTKNDSFSSLANNMRDAKNQMDDESKEASENASIRILAKIRERLEDIGEPSYKIYEKPENENSTENEKEQVIECVACLMPIQPGDIAICMPCCGSLCHVSCMSKISRVHRSYMNHACPHCTHELTQEQEDTFLEMYTVLESGGRNE